ncbi:MAG: hypothetical protein ACTIAP_12665, partial [Cellulosimicrobium funkei]
LHANTLDPEGSAVALLDAAAANPGGAGAVFTFEGRMVDEPVLRHARAVLDRVVLDRAPSDG